MNCAARVECPRCDMSSSQDYDHDAPHCFICLETRGEDELLRGCACRGSAGFAHVECLVQAAQVNRTLWRECITCKQPWSGLLALNLAWAHWDAVESRPENDRERLAAAMTLTWSLTLSGERAQALQLGQETLALAQQHYGHEDDDTLSAAGWLAAVHGAMGNDRKALPLATMVLEVHRRKHGDDHTMTMSAVNNLGVTQKRLGNYAEALPLHVEALEGTRRHRGDNHWQTLTSIGNLAGLHGAMENYDLALPLMQEALDGTRRLLGNEHPDTLALLGKLGRLYSDMGDHEAAEPLLQESVQGLSVAQSGQQHLQTQRRTVKKALATNTKRKTRSRLWMAARSGAAAVLDAVRPKEQHTATN